VDTHDRLFLVVFGVVATGFALTATGYAAERRPGREVMLF
jgi:hypothetical protein